MRTSVTAQQLAAIIEEKTKRLVSYQTRLGSFEHSSSPSSHDFDKAITYNALFPTTLIVGALHRLQNHLEVKKLAHKSLSFLQKQVSNMWSFNYWIRDSAESKALPYPDDMDDTFCALTSLWLFQPQLFDGEVLAKIVTLLTVVEQKEGGPYATWLVPPTADPVWKDVDVAVNANIAYFLSLQGITLPNVIRFIEACITENRLESPYYPSMYPIIYFLSRFYKGKCKKYLVEQLLASQQKDGGWGNVLDTSLAITALIHFKHKSKWVERGIHYLIEHAHETENPYAFYIDPAVKEKTYYAGSPALTTAFYVEALDIYSQEIIRTESKKKRVQDTLNQPKIYAHIVKELNRKYVTYPTILSKKLQQLSKQLLEKNAQHFIPLLPYYFYSTLHKSKHNISSEMLTQLGVANVFGWLAYTIYDDFLDNEGKPDLLSIANLLLRELTTIFHTVLPENKQFIAFFESTMNDLDAANMWEVSNCRFLPDKIMTIDEIPIPDFRDCEVLAQKSFGHALGPIAILFALGHGKNSDEMKATITFFYHYLLARQLDDDVHDWEEDFRQGRINPIGAIIFAEWKKRNKRPQKTISLNTIIREMRELLWQEKIEDITTLIMEHVTLAQSSIQNTTFIGQTDIFDHMLTPIQHSMKKALAERQKVLDFLSAYK